MTEIFVLFYIVYVPFVNMLFIILMVFNVMSVLKSTLYKKHDMMQNISETKRSAVSL